MKLIFLHRKKSGGMASLLVNVQQKNIKHKFASDIGTSREQQDKNSHASTQNLELFGVFVKIILC